MEQKRFVDDCTILKTVLIYSLTYNYLFNIQKILQLFINPPIFRYIYLFLDYFHIFYDVLLPTNSTKNFSEAGSLNLNINDSYSQRQNYQSVSNCSSFFFSNNSSRKFSINSAILSQYHLISATKLAHYWIPSSINAFEKKQIWKISNFFFSKNISDTDIFTLIYSTNMHYDVIEKQKHSVTHYYIFFQI